MSIGGILAARLDHQKQNFSESFLNFSLKWQRASHEDESDKLFEKFNSNLGYYPGKDVTIFRLRERGELKIFST